MKLTVKSIEKGVSGLILESDASEIPEYHEIGGVGRLQIKINCASLVDGGFLAKGDVAGQIRPECGRCNEKLEQSLKLHFNLLASVRNEYGFEWQDDENQGIEDYQIVLGPDVEEISLDSIIVEQLLLNYNLHPLPELDSANRCKECGLSSWGAEKTKKVERIDPRWSGLNALKDPQTNRNGLKKGPKGK